MFFFKEVGNRSYRQVQMYITCKNLRPVFLYVNIESSLVVRSIRKKAKMKMESNTPITVFSKSRFHSHGIKIRRQHQSARRNYVYGSPNILKNFISQRRNVPLMLSL